MAERKSLKPEPSEPRSKAAKGDPSPGAEGAGPDAAPAPRLSAADPDEREWLERARARDASAYRRLVERHRDRAYTLALRMLRTPADAEEVVQDAFVRAWLALPAFRGESSFGTWLHKIVVRRAIDRAAVLRRRRDRETGIEAAGGAAAHSSHDSESSARARRLEQLLAALPDAQRGAITLFYYHDRSVDQVAEILGVPVGTVKTHLSRARAALRAAWLDQERKDQR